MVPWDHHRLCHLRPGTSGTGSSCRWHCKWEDDLKTECQEGSEGRRLSSKPPRLGPHGTSSIPTLPRQRCGHPCGWAESVGKVIPEVSVGRSPTARGGSFAKGAWVLRGPEMRHHVSSHRAMHRLLPVLCSPLRPRYTRLPVLHRSTSRLPLSDRHDTSLKCKARHLRPGRRTREQNAPGRSPTTQLFIPHQSTIST